MSEPTDKRPRNLRGDSFPVEGFALTSAVMNGGGPGSIGPDRLLEFGEHSGITFEVRATGRAD